MENKSPARAAGAFVLLVTALLLALTVWLTRDALEQVIYELSTDSAVTGLQAQAAVRFKGVDVGKVVAVAFDPQASGRVLIRIAIDRQAPVTSSTSSSVRVRPCSTAVGAVTQRRRRSPLIIASSSGEMGKPSPDAWRRK